MSATDVHITATWAQRRTLEELSKAVQERVKHLHETTEDATIATCINVLRSLRAQTGIIKASSPIIDSNYKIEIATTNYRSGWATPPRKHKRGRRVIRLGNSLAIDKDEHGKRVVNLAGSYTKSENPQVYHLTITRTDTGHKFYDSLCIAKSQDDVRKFANQRIKRRMSQYKGVSKRLLGLAMHKVSNRQNVTDPVESVVNSRPLSNNYLNNLALVKKQGSGFSSGGISIEVIDNLVNSLLALKNGQSSVNESLQKAVNSTIGIINKHMQKVGSFDEKLSAPFAK